MFLDLSVADIIIQPIISNALREKSIKCEKKWKGESFLCTRQHQT